MTMAMWAQGRLYVAVLDGGQPTDAEWARWVELGMQRNGLEQRALVEARGGGPTPKQRRSILSANKAHARIAIMTNATFVRGIVTAFSWFDVALRAFPLDGHNAAVKYLGLTPEEIATTFEMLPRIRAEAGVREP